MKATSLMLLYDIPFETALREHSSDWSALVIFFSGLMGIVALIYRNPQVMSSLIIRAFKSNSDKLYFSTPAIDSVDRLILFLIYFSGCYLCLRFFDLPETVPYAFWLLFALPLVLVLYFIVPYYSVFFTLGEQKKAKHILRNQGAPFYLFGIALIALGGFLFVDFSSIWVLQISFLSLSLIVLIWIHLRVFRELVLSGVSVYYIFIYFCSLELLPIAFLWVFFLRF